MYKIKEIVFIILTVYLRISKKRKIIQCEHKSVILFFITKIESVMKMYSYTIAY